MREVELVREALARMGERAREIEAQMSLERCQGLEADWTAVAEALGSIAELAQHGEAKAWLIAYESQSFDLNAEEG